MPQQGPSVGPAVSYAPGTWVALAGPDVWLLAETAPDGPVVSACWAAVEAGEGADGVLRVIAREGLRAVPSFVLAGRTGDATRVLVHGAARADVREADGSGVAVAAAGSPTWVERRVGVDADVRLSAARPASSVLLPLRHGVVLAGAVSIVAQPAAEAAHQLAAALGTRGQPTVVARAERLAVVVDLPPPAGRPVEVEPAPVGVPVDAPAVPDLPPPIGSPVDVAPVTVAAVLCPQRHLNAPWAPACRVCGSPVPPQPPFPAPRPTLGVLVLSNGTRVAVDRDVVLGRAPFDAQPGPVPPHLVPVTRGGSDVSRNHVRVVVDDWLVRVVDLGSVNGTVVTLPRQAPVRLRPHDPFTIVAGTTMAIADEVTVRFEAAPT